MTDLTPPAPPSPLGWLDEADVLAHMKLPVGTDTTDMERYVNAAEAWVARWMRVPDNPKATAPDLYQAAVLITADLWADRQTSGGVQSGGPDLGFYRLGDWSVHVQRLLDGHRRWSEMMA